MARGIATDVFQNFKYQVVDAGAGDVLNAKVEGGFSQVSIPDVTLDVIEYKEGIHTWKRKYPGSPTVADVTLGRGVAKNRTRFFQWVLAAINGNEYRTDLVIHVFHRDQWATGVNDLAGDLTLLEKPTASLQIKLKQAFAMMVRPGSDLDAQGADILLEEIQIACESIEITRNNVKDAPFAGVKP
jgi:phage tail-like protein